jgi:exodeoxyribonuclease VII small subunit
MSRKHQEPAGPPPFEENLNRLEAIVKRLEESELSLEESLKLFEEGTELSGACHRQLEEAEQRVEVLVKRGSGVTPEPFGSAPQSSPDSATDSKE